MREIIISSVQDLGQQEVIRPGEKPKVVTFEEMCVTGGVVNVYNACIMAEKMSQGK